MTERSRLQQHRPAIVSAPGETIGDLLEERELRQAELAEACLKFFGVASVGAWRQQYGEQSNMSAAYRASESHQKHPGAVATWLRVGEIEAAQIACVPFDREKFIGALTEARKLTLEMDPSSFIPLLRQLLASCGVALVISRAPKGCPLYGAVKWLSPQKVLIQLSVRGLILLC